MPTTTTHQPEILIRFDSATWKPTIFFSSISDAEMERLRILAEKMLAGIDGEVRPDGQ